MTRAARLFSLLTGTVMLVCAAPLPAQGLCGADQGKLLLTAGFSTVEGAGGGGLTPWALITGHGSSDNWGANSYVTGIGLRDFEFVSAGVGIGIRDRFELSFGRQMLDATDGALDGISLSQDVIGAKLRIFGDAVYGQDSWTPQVVIATTTRRSARRARSRTCCGENSQSAWSIAREAATSAASVRAQHGMRSLPGRRTVTSRSSRPTPTWGASRHRSRDSPGTRLAPISPRKWVSRRPS